MQEVYTSTKAPTVLASTSGQKRRVLTEGVGCPRARASSGGAEEQRVNAGRGRRGLLQHVEGEACCSVCDSSGRTPPVGRASSEQERGHMQERTNAADGGAMVGGAMRERQRPWHVSWMPSRFGTARRGKGGATALQSLPGRLGGGENSNGAKQANVVHTGGKTQRVCRGNAAR
jgi:hypothetical protein